MVSGIISNDCVRCAGYLKAYFANMLGIATRGVRVCVRMFGYLFVFGIGYTDSTGLRVAHDSDCVA